MRILHSIHCTVIGYLHRLPVCACVWLRGGSRSRITSNSCLGSPRGRGIVSRTELAICPRQREQSGERVHFLLKNSRRTTHKTPQEGKFKAGIPTGNRLDSVACRKSPSTETIVSENGQGAAFPEEPVTINRCEPAERRVLTPCIGSADVCDAVCPPPVEGLEYLLIFGQIDQGPLQERRVARRQTVASGTLRGGQNGQ